MQLQEEGLGLRAALRESSLKRIDVMHAAELGSPDMCWRIYQNFTPYREQFRFEGWHRERYLLRAADAGHNDARFELAQALRAGALDIGEDGTPRPAGGSRASRGSTTPGTCWSAPPPRITPAPCTPYARRVRATGTPPPPAACAGAPERTPTAGTRCPLH
ncbi:hypothetical protein ACXXDK_04890 [Deinococcus sp. PESE-38]